MPTPVLLKDIIPETKIVAVATITQVLHHPNFLSNAENKVRQGFLI